MKKIIATTAALILVLAIIAPAIAGPEFFPCLTVVVDKEYEEESGLWVIICQDKEGNIWTFFNEEGDWDEGDIANLLLWDVTGHYEDIEVVEVY